MVIGNTNLQFKPISVGRASARRGEALAKTGARLILASTEADFTSVIRILKPDT